MSYQLGIDLGTTYTAAAICRGTDRAPAGADVVTLGTRSASVASVLYLADDGSVLVGEAAERRALSDPDRVVREFKRRIGDEIPVMVADRPHQAHELAARMIRWVVDQVSEREGGVPRRVAVTHPASWGQHKKDLLVDALRTVGLTVTFLAEPQAAAVSYAHAERVEPGSTIAVYDLGGGTFDAAVVRKTVGGGFELLGRPEGIERLGGIDFDEVVFGHVREGLGAALENLDPDDSDVLSAVARLRRECVEAKEALSSDTEATIPVLLPDLRTQSRLVRAEFETMIRPALEETVDALRRAVASAGLTPADLTAVLLVGGSSRIPLVSQLVSEGLGRPVAVDADPKMAIALGAALAISPQQRPPASAGAGAVAAAPAGAPPRIPSGADAPARPPMSRPGPPPSAPAPPRPESPRREPARPMSAFDGRQSPPRPGVGYRAPDERGYSRTAGAHGDGGGGRPTGLLVGVGGAIVLLVVLVVALLWPSSGSTGSDGTGSSADLPPSDNVTTAPAAPAPGRGSTARPNPPAKTTPKAPAPTKQPPPPPSPSSPETRPSSPAPTNSSTPDSGEEPGGGGGGEEENQGSDRNGSGSNTVTPSGGTSSAAADDGGAGGDTPNQTHLPVSKQTMSSNPAANPFGVRDNR